MIADSSALPEQIVKDVIASAFQSAGQRCSAARVLFVQEDIADKVTAMLAGAMAEQLVGDPGLLSTDLGLGDRRRRAQDPRRPCRAHGSRSEEDRRSASAAESTSHGTYFAPRSYEIPSLETPATREIFGPVLGVIRSKGSTWRRSSSRLTAPTLA